MSSKVYFTSFCTNNAESVTQKLARLVMSAGMGKIDFEGKYVAIKLHFGEMGNMSYLRPGYIRTIVQIIKDLGGKPFLTDCNTLYVGSRKNALDHLETAYLNGFNPYNVGCHLLIADGLRGTDDVEVPVEGEYIKTAYIGRAVMDADIVVSVSHFKGHEGTGIGGTLKNLGMGCGSGRGKAAQHSTCRPQVDPENCVGCGICQENCAHGAPILTDDGVMHIDWNKCVGCGRCIDACPMKTIHASQDAGNILLGAKIAEYSKAVVQNRPQFHISLVMDVSPYCDCHNCNDIPIVPDVGMFASTDPVALDLACAEAVLKQPVNPGSKLDKADKTGKDYFTADFPHTNWRAQIAHGKKIGLGEDSYELIEV